MVIQISASALTYEEWESQTTGIELNDMNYRNAPLSIDVNILGTENIYVVNNMSEFMRMFEMMKKYKIRNTCIYVKNENAELADRIKAVIDDYKNSNPGDMKGISCDIYDGFYFKNKNHFKYHPYQQNNGKLLEINFSYRPYIDYSVMYLPKISTEEELYDLYRRTVRNKMDMSETVAAYGLENIGINDVDDIVAVINKKFGTNLTEKNIIRGDHTYSNYNGSGNDIYTFRFRLSGKGENNIFMNVFYDDREEEILKTALLKKLTPDMDEYTKVKIIAYSVGTLCKKYNITNRIPKDYSIADEEGRCMHYSYLFDKMLKMNGIEAEEVIDLEVMDHEWNIVKIDGEWYQADITRISAYDPRVIDCEKLGFTPADDETFENLGYVWNKSYYPKCTSKRFLDDNKYGGNPYFKNGSAPAEIQMPRETVPDEKLHVMVDEMAAGPMTSYRKYAAVIMDDKRGRILELIEQNVSENGEYEIPAVIDGITVRSIGRFAIKNKFYNKLILPETLEEISEYSCWFNNFIQKIVFKGHTFAAYNSITANEILAPNGIDMEGFLTNIQAQALGKLGVPVHTNFSDKDTNVFYEYVDEETALVLNRPYNFDAVVPQNFTRLLYYAGKGYYYDEPWNTLSIHGGVKYIDPQVGYLNRYYNVDESNANYSSLDGVLYNKDKTKLISVPIGTRSITIPDTVKEIGRFAFAYCYNLKEITLPKSVEAVDAESFYKISGLESIVIPGKIPQGMKIDSGETVKIYSSDIKSVEGAEVTSKAYTEAKYDGEKLSLKRTDNAPLYVLVYNTKNELTDVIIGRSGEISQNTKSDAYKIKVFCLNDSITPLDDAQTIMLSDIYK